MASSADRQKEFRKRMEAEGYIQVTGWVPAAQASDVRILMKRLMTDADLEVGPLRNVRTGRLERK